MFPGFYGNSLYNGIYGALVPYGTLNLTDASPAQSWVEPLSLSDVKAFLVLQESSPADGIDDNMISSMFIPAARELAEFFQGRDLVRKQYDLTFDYWSSYAFTLRAPLVSVDLFTYKDSAGNVTTLAPGTGYIVDTGKEPGLVMPPYNVSWPSFTPWPSSAILIRFTAGYSATHPFWLTAGGRIKMGMLYLISGWYEGRLPTTFGSVTEIPFAVSACLGYGRREHVG